MPSDVSFNTSGPRPNNRPRDIGKRTNGWRRRKEALGRKTTALVRMVSRACKAGIDASFVLSDSRFAHDEVISKICGIGYGVICRLKRGKVRYGYQGRKFTLRQLWQQAKKRTVRTGRLQVRAVCPDAKLPETGDVRLVFVSDGKKQWHVFLSADSDLQASEISDCYARRRAIKIFFKDAGQMLYIGKEQSKTSDAVVASYGMVMIRYLLPPST